MSGPRSHPTAILLALLVALPAGLGPAVAAPAGPLSRSEVVARLDTDGLAEIDHLGFVAGQWEGRAVRNDVWIEFQADPQSGAVTSLHPID